MLKTMAIITDTQSNDELFNIIHTYFIRMIINK